MDEGIPGFNMLPDANAVREQHKPRDENQPRTLCSIQISAGRNGT